MPVSLMSRGLSVPLCVAAAMGGSAAPASAQVYNDVSFATVGGQAMLLDLNVPANPAGRPYPLVIFVHGGGWTSGTHNNVAPYIAALPAQGIAYASVQYRLTSEAGQWGDEPVIFPAQIHDVKGAVRFLRANAATYGIDPSRFAAWGPSAGGHLVALLGTSGGVAELEGTIGGNLHVASNVQAVVDYYGPTDILNMQLDVTTPPGSTQNHDANTSGESKLIGFDDPGQGIGVLRANKDNPASPYPELIALTVALNPITHVDAADPPFFIVHGENDTTVPTHQSQRLADALTTAGVDFSIHRVAGMGHHVPPAEYSTAATAFLQQVFAQPPAATH